MIRTMEMTRVDTIGSKKTSYSLVAPSEAYKMETKPEGSSRYRCLIIFNCFLSILFLISFVVALLGYQQIKSEIETFQQEVSELRSELNSTKVKVEDTPKKGNVDLENSLKHHHQYEEQFKRLDGALINERNTRKELEENMEEKIRSVSQNMLEKIENVILENKLSYSKSSAFMEELGRKISTLQSDFGKLEQRINTMDQSVSSYIANAVNESVTIQNRIHQLEESDIYQRVLDLNNTAQMLNESLNETILSTRQDTSLKLNDITQALKTEVNLFQNKIMQTRADIVEMNTTINNLASKLVPNVNKEKLKGQLASITSGSADAISVSSDELKLVKEELKEIQKRVTTEIDILSVKENMLTRNVERVDDGFKLLDVKVDKISEKTDLLGTQIEKVANIVTDILKN